MKVICHALWLPKKGNTADEYEDAVAPTDSLESERDSFRCAVADGATETSFSGLWAKLLVEGYVNGNDRQNLKEQWQKSVGGKQLAWYAEEKVQSGAYAALVCLNLVGNGTAGTWQAEAIGDSCLVVIRQKDMIVKFPINRSAEFNSTPALLSSNLDDGKDHSENFQRTGGNWQRGDIFYLMSDALAHWVYKREEQYADAGFYLQAMKQQKDLEEFVSIQRELVDEDSRPLMRNDDVTLLQVIVE